VKRITNKWLLVAAITPILLVVTVCHFHGGKKVLHNTQTIAITGRSYRLKDRATMAGKEDKNKKIKAKPNEPSTAEPAS
jgi:hypothetical protein